MPISQEFLSNIDDNVNEFNFCSLYPPIGNEDLEKLIKFLKNNKDNLKTLLLNENEISDQGAHALTYLKKLETLAISWNQITDDGAKSISRMESLVNLDIVENNITDEGMAEIITNLSNLKSISLTSEVISDKTIQAILSHSNLEEVIIFDDENIDSEVLEQLDKHTMYNKMKKEKDNDHDALTGKAPKSPATTMLF